MTDPTVDVTAVEESAEQLRHEIVPAPALAVTPQVKAAELVERLDIIKDAAEKAMQQDVDFGVIPGTNKPTLLKPGAEKLGVLFQLDIQLSNEKTWGPSDHLTVVSHATVFHAPTGARLGYGEGVCTTRERKYAYRQQNRTCPTCGLESIIKGKAEYGGGWLCFKKKGGCGAKWPAGAPAIEGQEVGEIENPDLPDLWNTVVKMAEKRARIDAVLAVTGASALFTQDMEDAAVAGAEAAPVTPSGDAPVTMDDAPAPEPTCTPEQYQAILVLFAQAQRNGLKFDDWLKHLDVIGAPPSSVIGERVKGLPVDIADDLRTWLEAFAEDKAA